MLFWWRQLFQTHPVWGRNFISFPYQYSYSFCHYVWYIIFFLERLRLNTTVVNISIWWVVYQGNKSRTVPLWFSAFDFAFQEVFCCAKNFIILFQITLLILQSKYKNKGKHLKSRTVVLMQEQCRAYIQKHGYYTNMKDKYLKLAEQERTQLQETDIRG